MCRHDYKDNHDVRRDLFNADAEIDGKTDQIVKQGRLPLGDEAALGRRRSAPDEASRLARQAISYCEPIS